MRAEARSPRQQLAAWREAGDDRLDPARFRFVEALAARLEGQPEAVRALLETRLATLVQRYAEDLTTARARADEPARPASAGGALSPLLAQLSARRHGTGAEAAGLPQLPALAEFRQLWSELLGERRLRQSMAPVPADAGPLNSAVLVHRAIALMREASPDYLRHFLAYADHLCWLERLHDARTPATTATAAARRTTPRKPRRRRE